MKKRGFEPDYEFTEEELLKELECANKVRDDQVPAAPLDEFKRIMERIESGYEDSAKR